jgi:polysaccharide deacetylase family protein (PEP-CTERM system associated)
MKDRFQGYLGVDVEDWYNMMILGSAGCVLPPTEAVVRNTERLLRIFEDKGVRATFFFLGEVADHYPGLVRQVVKSGHEPAVHGYHHHLLTSLSREAYRDSLVKAKSAVEQAGGVGVLGYRATDFGINRRTWYALEIIAEVGFKYDSSIFPFGGPRYGIATAPCEPHWIVTKEGRLLEIPVSVVKVLGLRIPAGGGGYMRHFPWVYTDFTLRLVHSSGQPIVFYLHPYEIEHPTSIPVLPQFLTPSQVSDFRREHRWQTRNRQHTGGKLKKLFSLCEFHEMKLLYEAEASKLNAQTSHRDH